MVVRLFLQPLCNQYASYEYQQRLTKAQAVSSMSRKGDCYDNAPMESFFSTLKRERVHRRRYWGREEATADLADYIDRFYNPQRRHSQLGGLSPVQFEARRIYASPRVHKSGGRPARLAVASRRSALPLQVRVQERQHGPVAATWFC